MTNSNLQESIEDKNTPIVADTPAWNRPALNPIDPTKIMEEEEIFSQGSNSPTKKNNPLAA